MPSVSSGVMREACALPTPPTIGSLNTPIGTWTGFHVVKYLARILVTIHHRILAGKCRKENSTLAEECNGMGRDLGG